MSDFVTWLSLLFRTSSTYLVGMLITVLRKRETGLSHWIYNGMTDLNNVNSSLMFQNGGKTAFPFYIQLFRERLSEKVHTTIPKGFASGFEFTVL